MKTNLRGFCIFVFQPMVILIGGGVSETLQILKDRGNKVSIASGQKLKDTSLGKGFNFIDLGLSDISMLSENDTIPSLLAKHRRENFFNPEETIKGISILKKSHKEDPVDLVISDCFCKVGSLFSALEKIPCVSIAPYPKKVSGEVKEDIDKLHAIFSEQISSSFGELPESFDEKYPLVFKSSQLNLFFSTPSFDDIEETVKDKFVGGSKIERENTESNSIYYSFGTLFWSKKQINSILKVAKSKPTLKFYISQGLSIKDTHQTLDFVLAAAININPYAKQRTK